MKKNYLINYLVKNDGTVFNCYTIVNSLDNIEDYLQTHFENLKQLYEDGESFELVGNSERYFELVPIDVDVERQVLKDEKEEVECDG